MDLVHSWVVVVMVASSSVQPRQEYHAPRSVQPRQEYHAPRRHPRQQQHALPPTPPTASPARKEYDTGDALHVSKLENVLPGALDLQQQGEERHLAPLNNSIMRVDGFPRREPSSHYPGAGPLPQHRTKRGCGVVIRGPFYPYFTTRDSLRQAGNVATCCVLSSTLLLVTSALVNRCSCWW